jgi:hypothetical protein
MNEYQRAAEAITAELNRLKGLSEAAEVLNSIGSLEQAANEARSRVDKLQADEQAAKDRVAGFDAEYEKKRFAVKKQADQVLADAEQAKAGADDYAARLVAEAQAKAEGIVADAKAKVASLDSRAQKLSDAIRAVG